MRYESGQFGSFEGLDNRKTVLNLFVRMGQGFSVEEGCRRRAAFLQGIIRRSDNGFARATCVVSPCTAVEAYFLFTAITGCLGVDVDRAARLLEQEVRGGSQRCHQAGKTG